MGANVFDLIIIVVLAWSAYRGFTKGIISSAASLLALLLGIWGAIKFSYITGGYLSGIINVEPKVLGIIAFAVTFVLIVIGVHFVAKAVEGIAKAVALGIVNKVFGAAFGVLKTAFIISVIMFFVNAADAKTGFIEPTFKSQSLFYAPISNFAPTIFKKLDFDEIKNEVEEKTQGLDI